MSFALTLAFGFGVGLRRGLDAVAQSVDNTVDAPAENPFVVVFSGIDTVIGGVIETAVGVETLVDLDCFVGVVVPQIDFEDVAGPAPENTLGFDVGPAGFGLFVTILELFQLFQGGRAHVVELDALFGLVTGAGALGLTGTGRSGNSGRCGSRGHDSSFDVRGRRRAIGVLIRESTNQLAVGDVPNLIFNRGLAGAIGESKGRQK